MLNGDTDRMISYHNNNADQSITFVDGVFLGG